MPYTKPMPRAGTYNFKFLANIAIIFGFSPNTVYIFASTPHIPVCAAAAPQDAQLWNQPAQNYLPHFVNNSINFPKFACRKRQAALHTQPWPEGTHRYCAGPRQGRTSLPDTTAS